MKKMLLLLLLIILLINNSLEIILHCPNGQRQECKEKFDILLLRNVWHCKCVNA